MAKIKTVEATQDLIDRLKGHLRKADNDECMAGSGGSADEAMQTGFEVSKWCKVFMADETPVCVFGVAPLTMLSETGVPWMLGTDLVRRYPRAIVVLGKMYVKLMLKDYIRLENFVHIENNIAIKWLKNCGFEFDGAKPYGVKKELFHKFFISREN